MKKSILACISMICISSSLLFGQSSEISDTQIRTPILRVGTSSQSANIVLKAGKSMITDSDPDDNLIIGSVNAYNAKMAIINSAFRYGLLIDALNTSGGYGLFLKGSGKVEGDLDVTGTISKGSGSFKIDHPLDPANKYLYHSFVESPDMMNIYNGNIVSDQTGMAKVELPEYFEALNKDFRYQLTVIGDLAQAVVFKKVLDNHFVIKTDKPNVEVSWQITGIRKDAYAEKNRIPNTVEKPDHEKGKYLYPNAFK